MECSSQSIPCIYTKTYTFRLITSNIHIHTHNTYPPTHARTGLRQPRNAAGGGGGHRAGVAEDEPPRAAGLRAEAQADPGREAGPVLLGRGVIGVGAGVDVVLTWWPGLGWAAAGIFGRLRWRVGQSNQIKRKQGGQYCVPPGNRNRPISSIEKLSRARVRIMQKSIHFFYSYVAASPRRPLARGVGAESFAPSSPPSQPREPLLARMPGLGRFPNFGWSISSLLV